MGLSKIDIISEAVVDSLGDHLRKKVRSLQKVLNEFPSGNVKLRYPSISIITSGTADHTPLQPYIKKKDLPNSKNKMKVLYVVGKFEWNLQIDLWAGTKPERNQVFEEIQEVFRSQFPVMGLILESASRGNWSKFTRPPLEQSH